MASPKEPSHVTLFTDGACSGNPGPGGWAYVLRHDASRVEKRGWGAEADTTNNRMELRACIEGLRALKRRCRVRIVTDSKYVVQGMTEWLPKWRANGWRRRVGKGFKPLKNDDLWRELAELAGQHEVTFEHVAGHAGHPENELCDHLAVQAYRSAYGVGSPPDVAG